MSYESLDFQIDKGDQDQDLMAHVSTDNEKTPLVVNRVIDESPKEGRLTAYLAFVAAVAAIAAFNFGYHNGVINIPKDVIANCSSPASPDGVSVSGLDLPDCFNIDDTYWGTIVGLFPIGGLVGGLVGGYIADNLGRRYTIGLTNVFFLLGSGLQGFALTPTYLAVGRFFVGFGSGVTSAVVPMFIGEITPSNLRGAFGVMFQLSLTIGISVSQLIGLGLSNVPGWRWLLGFTTWTSIIQIILLVFCCESPRWLVLKRRTEEAEIVLTKLRGTLDVQDEINLINLGQSSVIANEDQSYNIIRLLRNKSMWRPLIVAIALSLAQQLSGINVVFYYSTDLFKQTIPDQAELMTVLIGIFNVLLTVLAIFLMDRLGRRPLLLIGELGMALIAVLFVISYTYGVSILGVFSAFLYVLVFAIGLGPIPFLIISEIFPTNAVGTASSIAMPFNWAANYAVAQIFPILQANWPINLVFVPFVVTNSISFVFTLFLVPETKGRSMEEITGAYSS